MVKDDHFSECGGQEVNIPVCAVIIGANILWSIRTASSSRSSTALTPCGLCCSRTPRPGLTMAATWDPEATLAWGDGMGREFYDKGANVQGSNPVMRS